VETMSQDNLRRLPHASDARRLSRRVMLRGMAIAGAGLGASLLAACQQAGPPAAPTAAAKPSATFFDTGLLLMSANRPVGSPAA